MRDGIIWAETLEEPAAIRSTVADAREPARTIASATLIEAGPRQSVEGSDLLPLPASASEDLASLTAVSPVALLAFALARARGHDPDRPTWTERYRSQGLTPSWGPGKSREPTHFAQRIIDS
jgi:fructoselysine-6-P-deglycase FrlB-like protein